MMRLLGEELESILTNFDKFMSNTHSQIIRAVREGGVVSLLKTVDEIQKQAHAIVVAERFVSNVKIDSPLAYMDTLFKLLSNFDAANDPESFRILVSPFRAMFGTYAQHLTNWVEYGQLSKTPITFLYRE